MDDVSPGTEPSSVLLTEVRGLQRRRGLDLMAQEDVARSLADRAAVAGEPVALALALLVLADVLCARARTEESIALVHRAERIGVGIGAEEVISRAHFVRSVLHVQAGDPVQARCHVLEQLDRLPADAPVWLRAEGLILMTSYLDPRREDFEGPLREAWQIATELEDPVLQLYILNNQAWLTSEVGRLDEALRSADRMREIAQSFGIPLRSADLDTLAVIELRSGRPEQAWATIRQALSEDSAVVNQADHVVIARLTAVRILSELGRFDEAEECLDAACDLVRRRNLLGHVASVEQATASFLAGRDRFEEAYHHHVLFHDADAALRVRQDASRAFLAQARFDTATAVRDRDRYRVLAMTDPLTKLPNRRAAEEHLGRVLGEDGPVAVAIVDVDHFKQINDTRSHDAGDVVLRELAGLLSRWTEGLPATFCARLGGEEFLLVWQGWRTEEAAVSAEALRARIAATDWDPVTRGLPVTVSIGLADDQAGTSDLPALLAAADEQLYVAKRAGRDQIRVR